MEVKNLKTGSCYTFDKTIAVRDNVLEGVYILPSKLTRGAINFADRLLPTVDHFCVIELLETKSNDVTFSRNYPIIAKVDLHMVDGTTIEADKSGNAFYIWALPNIKLHGPTDADKSNKAIALNELKALPPSYVAKFPGGIDFQNAKSTFGKGRKTKKKRKPSSSRGTRSRP
jgi:hypothetical protein